MSIKKVFNTIVIAAGLTGAVGMSSCRGPIHRIGRAINPIVERVDSFASSKFNQVDTAGLELFKVDTLVIKNKDLNNPLELSYKLQDKAARSIKKVVTDSKPVTGIAVDYKGNPNIVTNLSHETEPLYLPSSVQAIMQKKVFANTDETVFYVPVEYYAKRNPMIEPKHFRK